jgi:hypothetical protein
MTPLFKKLNFKQYKNVLILNHPVEFEKEVKLIKNYTIINTKLVDSKEIEFVLTFVKTKEDIDKLAPAIHKNLIGDGIVWFAYPKGTSKKYNVEISRDKGWNLLRELGFETVRAVSIDADWSALRFRRVEFIKVMTRKK